MPGRFVDAFRSLEGDVVVRVRAGGEHVAADLHQSALGGATEHDARIIDVEIGLHVGAAPQAVDGDDVVVHPFQDRPEGMGDVGHPPAAEQPLVPPVAGAGGVLDLVHVVALGVVGLAEEPGARHLFDQHVFLIVAAVLAHHVFRGGGARGAHQLVALLEGDRGGYFGERVNAALQGGHAHGGVQVHRRRHDHHVDPALQQVLIAAEELDPAELPPDRL